MRLAFFLLLLASAVHLGQIRHLPVLTTRPVVGILSLENLDYSTELGSSYINASYVKWVEMGGARVFPLQIDHDWTELTYLATHANGLLFTGGDANFSHPNATLTSYGKIACGLVDLAKDLNDQGVYYPIWGTCLGLQILHFCAHQSIDTVRKTPGKPSPVLHSFTEAGENSRLFKNPEGKRVRESMEREAIAYMSHNDGVYPNEYTMYRNLSDMYAVLSTTKTESGLEYVSIIEGWTYPFYAVQFHPELNIFSWNGKKSIPHTSEAVKMSTYFSGFFVNEARKNANSFPAEDELSQYLIYNWKPYYVKSSSSQVYLFPR